MKKYTKKYSIILDNMDYVGYIINVRVWVNLPYRTNPYEQENPNGKENSCL